MTSSLILKTVRVFPLFSFAFTKTNGLDLDCICDLMLSRCHECRVLVSLARDLSALYAGTVILQVHRQVHPSP